MPTQGAITSLRRFRSASFDRCVLADTWRARRSGHALQGKSAIGSPTDFGKLIADDTEKWDKVIKFAGIKAN